MPPYLHTCAALAVLMVNAASAHAAETVTPPAGTSPLTLWYTQPAGKWEEALPLGNGRLGAMVFGGIQKERLQLNEHTIWAGPPFPVPPKNGSDALRRARELFFAGKYAEGEALAVGLAVAGGVRERVAEGVTGAGVDGPQAEARKTPIRRMVIK